MNKYEAIFVLKSDLSEEERKSLFNQIAEAVTKRNGNVLSASIWAEKRKLCFSIKKSQEGMYYLLNFNALPASVKEIEQAYKLNENILRVLVTRL